MGKIESVYIHIPFCKNICTYCDFPKMYANDCLIDKYLLELEKEIKKLYKKELIKTIYIGGGTPSVLNTDQLRRLLEITNQFNKNDVEFTIEFNVEDISEEKLDLIKQYGVNRISIGVQTFNDKHLKYMGRNYDSSIIIPKINLTKKYFSNINIDLIYALPNQTLEELKEDLEQFLKLDIEHISTYSLIIEPNTILYIKKTKSISDIIDADMYEYITDTLKENNYNHYEISNFCKTKPSNHNLSYWNNTEYYGFGVGASGYIENVRYDNTKSINNYLQGHYRLTENILNRNTTIENEFILGFRKIQGINKSEFKTKYNTDITTYDNVRRLIKEGKLIDDSINIKIKKQYLYTENGILIDFIGENYE